MDRATRDHSSALFAAATDPARMGAIFEQHLRVPGGRPVEVVQCGVSFARGRGPRSLFQYDVRLRDPIAGREWNQVVSGVAYGGQRTRKAWEKLKLADDQIDRQPILCRAAYVPGLDLLLQVFPFDHELLALEPLMAGTLADLHGPVLARFGPGNWRLDEWQAESVRYRVDLRASVKLTVRASQPASGFASERRFFAKVYGGGHRVERAWTVQREVADALAAASEPVGLAPIVAYLADDRVLVQDEVQATSLSEILHGADPDQAAEAVRRAARAIATLHSLRLAAPEHRFELERTDPGRLRRSTDVLRRARPDLAAAVTEVEEGILIGLDAIGELAPVPVHGDLKLAHLLLNERCVVLLDLDKFAAGEPMLDVTNMLVPLRRERKTRTAGTSLARVFAEEYFAHVPAAWEQRLIPHYAWAILKEASGFATGLAQVPAEARSSRRERRENHVDLLLDEARELLAGRA
jgi:hypothetical protein